MPLTSVSTDVTSCWPGGILMTAASSPIPTATCSSLPVRSLKYLAMISNSVSDTSIPFHDQLSLCTFLVLSPNSGCGKIFKHLLLRGEGGVEGIQSKSVTDTINGLRRPSTQPSPRGRRGVL